MLSPNKMMQKKHSISVVIPAHNEMGCIEQVVRSSLEFLKNHLVFDQFEIIVVDDGSRDETPFILKKLKQDNMEKLTVITHRSNLGYGKAMTSGIKQAKNPLILLMDADGQFKIDPLNIIIKFIPEYDIVSGYRQKRMDPLPRIILGKTFSKIVSLFFGVQFEDINCGFKLFKKEALALNKLDFHSGVFYANILIGAIANGFKVKQYAIKHYKRKTGKQSGASLKVILASVIDIIRLKYIMMKS